MPDSEPDEQALTAVRSLEKAMEIENERHNESIRQLQAAIEDARALANPHQSPASEQRLPFCDSSSKKFSWANSTFRAERISFAHPALQDPDRDLTPKGCLESIGVSST